MQGEDGADEGSASDEEGFEVEGADVGDGSVWVKVRGWFTFEVRYKEL